MIIGKEQIKYKNKNKSMGQLNSRRKMSKKRNIVIYVLGLCEPYLHSHNNTNTTDITRSSDITIYRENGVRRSDWHG